jgi:Membrane-fusion protein
MDNFLLPSLRQELTLHPGPEQPDGSPGWVLHDPAANRFFLLGWASFEMLSRWSAHDAGQLMQAVNTQTTLTLELNDIWQLVQFLRENQLLQTQESEDLWRFHQRQHRGYLSWLLSHYLFFRIPLVRPDALLAQLLPWIKWVFRPMFWWMMAIITLSGLLMVSQQWDVFIHTFSSYGGWVAALGIAVALSVAKVVHELGHAFTARHFGCRVPAMGMAFLVMVPVLYTDTNDAWKLPSRRQRLLIGGAGMLAELVLASCATLLWCFLPDGPFRAGIFLLASTTWLATLAINASPFMRFDGYFLLSDFLQMPNLHTRAFALARWHLRQVLLGMEDPLPEHFSPSKQRGLICFAWVTWLYRLIIFTSIAFLVYHLFFKMLGIVLLMVELGWFVVRPIVNELQVWWQHRHTLRWEYRTGRTLIIFCALMLFLALPWQRGVSAPAVMEAAQSQAIYVPENALVGQVNIHDGDWVQQGQVLAVLTSDNLDYQIAQARVIAANLAWQVAQQPFSRGLDEQGAALKKLALAAQQQVESLLHQQARLTLTAPFAGRIADVNDALNPGTVVVQGERLMQVLGKEGIRGEGWVDEDTVTNLHSGDDAFFVPDSGETAAIPCRVGQIDRLNQSTLDQPLLASVYGGGIPVQVMEQRLVPINTIFRVRLEHCGAQPSPVRELAGKVVLQSSHRSFLQVAWQRLVINLGREAGL